MKSLRILLVMLIILTFSIAANAALYPSWGAPTVTDPQDNIAADVDIFPGIWWAQDNDWNYFRMDLAGSFGNSENSNLIYGIYFTTGDNSGLDGPQQRYVPDGLNDIKYSIDLNQDDTGAINASWNIAYYSTTFGDYWGSTPISTDNYLLTYYPTDSGTTIEWRLARTSNRLPEDFCFYGATWEYDALTGDNTTHDLTNKACTPEPGSLALLALGLTGLIARRRKQSAKSAK